MNGAVRSLTAVIVAAGVLYAMQRSTPLYSDITSPVPVAGRQGERVDTSAFAIGIAKVYLARSITFPSLSRTQHYATSGVWVVVESAVEAKNESLGLTSAEWLGPDGLRYRYSQRLTNVPGMPGNEQFEPGIPRPMLMIFEVPESQIAGARLLVARSPYAPLAEEAWIDMAALSTDDIHPSITLSRGGQQMPWILKVE
ncbi:MULTISPECIES: hypothetical protein [unclassified Mesorhizobium]|uniref:hypothetical protein n=1 Tax=unclassified Mesorhizobium TaxID=325217 RepID=UPI000701E7A4|nr:MULTISPECIES: hypothetical protein [unclassified Mesorhizobium]KQZ13525.1 hypothetical protein ASD27_05145 [Mesorhizobium sp. Root1471]KQZ36037.1 hypothetical protein ASD44_05140 [Mesorhizobium sp. Root554]MDR7032451.1 hypothetical protein [Mesorhizobium sp. BE184]